MATPPCNHELAAVCRPFIASNSLQTENAELAVSEIFSLQAEMKLLFNYGPHISRGDITPSFCGTLIAGRNWLAGAGTGVIFPLCPRPTEGVVYPFVSGNSSSGTELRPRERIRLSSGKCLFEFEKLDAISAKNSQHCRRELRGSPARSSGTCYVRKMLLFA